ncbi:hypothetical protein FN846DRAFT_988629 [Sphaerosporella brunnea]|uniref:Uncharacterized protein n=1 Tax=Sphaerosporella brunnea TaxID=1250544 RepID=A0A5J5F8M6_9PEZI|nr:hypothetical protein FN846DRAFT_988629 [Sphaerosporella brunnea]
MASLNVSQASFDDALFNEYLCLDGNTMGTQGGLPELAFGYNFEIPFGTVGPTVPSLDPPTQWMFSDEEWAALPILSEEGINSQENGVTSGASEQPIVDCLGLEPIAQWNATHGGFQSTTPLITPPMSTPASSQDFSSTWTSATPAANYLSTPRQSQDLPLYGALPGSYLPAPASATTTTPPSSRAKNARSSPSSGHRVQKADGRRKRAHGHGLKGFDQYDLSKSSELAKLMGALGQQLARRTKEADLQVEKRKVEVLKEMLLGGVSITEDQLNEALQDAEERARADCGLTELKAEIEAKKAEAAEIHNRLRGKATSRTS